MGVGAARRKNPQTPFTLRAAWFWGSKNVYRTPTMVFGRDPCVLLLATLDRLSLQAFLKEARGRNTTWRP